MSNFLQTTSEINIDKQHIITLFNTCVKGVEICLERTKCKPLWKRRTLVRNKNGYKA